MIKFFRKIRYDLIASRRFFNYLKYAIGEIVLVVIGILIALQVNQWNQKKIERKREFNYLKEIKTNLISDSLGLKTIIDFNNNKQVIYDSINSLFDIKYSKLEHSHFIVANFPIIASFELFKVNSTAFDNMKSADNLGILSNNLIRQELTEYYNYNIGGSQEKLVLQTRKLTDYLNKSIVTKEMVEQFLGIKNNFPSETTVDLQSDPVLFTFFGEGKSLMISQNKFVYDRLDKIKEITTLIDSEIEKLSE